MKKILYVSYGAGHANISSLIYKKMAERTDIVQQVLALTVAWKSFEKSDIPYKKLNDYKDSIVDWNNIVEIGKNIIEKVQLNNSDFSKEDAIIYFGIGYYCLVHDYGEEQAKKMFDSYGRTCFCPVFIMKQILKIEKPDTIVITCGVRTERAAGIAANELGIPVVRVADLPEYEETGCICTECVMNEYAKRFAEETLHVNSKNIVITGQPVFEDNLKIDSAEIERTRKELKLDKYSKMIIYLEEPGLPELAAVENYLIDLAKKTKDRLYVVKIHPNQNMPFYNDLPENIIFLKGYPLKNLLYNCDLAITKDSTAGMEAVLLDKPLINLTISPNGMDYSVYGISMKIDDLNHLSEAIDKSFDENDPSFKELKEGRYRFKNKDSSLDNIEKVILERIYE